MSGFKSNSRRMMGISKFMKLSEKNPTHVSIAHVFGDHI